MGISVDRPDGNIESIRHSCFLTVGTVTHEADLEPLERRAVSWSAKRLC